MEAPDLIPAQAPNGDWSDYVFAGDRRVARGDSYEDRILISGTATSTQYSLYAFQQLGDMPDMSLGRMTSFSYTTGLLTALRNKIGEVDADGLTVEARLVEVLVHEALVGKNRLPAVEVIFDRLEGRSRQRVEVADVTKQLREKSDAELQFHLDHDRWPDEQELLLLDTTHEGAE